MKKLSVFIKHALLIEHELPCELFYIFYDFLTYSAINDMDIVIQEVVNVSFLNLFINMTT